MIQASNATELLHATTFCPKDFFHLAFYLRESSKNNFVPSFLFSKLQVVQTECSRYTHLHLGASPLSRDGGLRENMGQGLRRVSGDKILRRALGKSRRSSDPRWHWPRYYFLHRYWQLTKTTEYIQIQDLATVTEVKGGFVKTLKNRKKCITCFISISN